MNVQELANDQAAELRAKLAGLRQAFNQAAENYPTNCPMPPPVQAWWRQFYEAILEYGQ